MQNGLCCALGDFDGVHIGHISVIKTAVENSAVFEPAVYTFNINCKGASTITDNETKQQILYSLGIKKVIFDDFEKIKMLTPLFFVNDVLIKQHNVKKIVCGSDFRFGKDASGDINTLKQICTPLGIEVIVVDTKSINGDKISSSKIREYISLGKMQQASKLLTRNFTISGNVIRGKGLGKKLNAPTVNIEIAKDCIVPKYGVYLTKTHVNGKVYNSVSNVGLRPSVENTTVPNVETHILNFNAQTYGEYITVEFIEMLRDEIKFDSKDKLILQINNDIARATDYFGGEQ